MQASARPARIGRRLALLGAPALVAACATPFRLPPVPRDHTGQATVLGVADERFFYLDDPGAVERVFTAAQERERARLGVTSAAALPAANILSVSGGGEDGAFGAGLLCGWSERGTRPVFNLVTGVSTGALTAPFAFLGPAYDDALRDVYTNVTIKDIAEPRGVLRAIWNDALADSAPLFRTISRHLDEAMLAALGKAWDEGRLLLIGTTDLDAQKPVVWNIGAIARSGHPGALDLIRRILLASAAVPGAFPPVMIDVEADGRHYQEMHVDGGAFAQAFLYPRQAAASRRGQLRNRRAVRPVHAWVIRNGRLQPGWEAVDRRTLDIAGRAISTMIFSSGVNDVLRMYNAAREDGVDFNLAFIDPGFAARSAAPFDQAYMRALFDYGFARGQAGYEWLKAPPVGQDLAPRAG